MVASAAEDGAPAATALPGKTREPVVTKGGKCNSQALPISFITESTLRV